MLVLTALTVPSVSGAQGVITTLHSFATVAGTCGQGGTGTNTDGAEPVAGLVWADGLLWGVAQCAGPMGGGTAFTVDSSGGFTVRVEFVIDGGAGDYPTGTLYLASDGNMYGTCPEGGANGGGTAFQLTTAGVLTPIFSFGPPAGPRAGVIQGTDGLLYGTLEAGAGGVYSLTTGGVFTLLHGFSGGADGSEPYGRLVQGPDGNFYGTTYGGGAHGQGTVFRITPAGALTTLHSFDGGDGTYPYGDLVYDGNGYFWGTTAEGGTAGNVGTIFKISPKGVFASVYSFTSGGMNTPKAGLVLATDGDFWGTASAAGSGPPPEHYGGIFKITPAGAFTAEAYFTGANGKSPTADLVQDSSGRLVFYGTTAGGGAYSEGTVFEFAP